MCHLMCNTSFSYIHNLVVMCTNMRRSPMHVFHLSLFVNFSPFDSLVLLVYF